MVFAGNSLGRTPKLSGLAKQLDHHQRHHDYRERIPIYGPSMLCTTGLANCSTAFCQGMQKLLPYLKERLKLT